jgi:hypothetical protein
MRLAAAEPNVHRDLLPFDQGYILEQKRNHALALEWDRAWIVPYAGKVFCQAHDPLARIFAQQRTVGFALPVVRLLQRIELA